MAAIEVTANKGTRSLTVSYDFGDNLNHATEKFGEDVVFSNMQQSMKISLQALIRRGFDKGLDDDAIMSQADAWIPGVAAQRSVDPIATITAKWASLDADARAELLQKLKAMQG